MKMREVYVPLENEVIDGVPTPFIEFEDFWKTHSTDDGFIMAIIDENNKVVN